MRIPRQTRLITYHKMTDVQTMALDTKTGYAAKVSVLTLDSD